MVYKHFSVCIFCKKNLSQYKSVLKLRKRIVSKTGIRTGSSVPEFYEFHRICLRRAVFEDSGRALLYRKVLEKIL